MKTADAIAEHLRRFAHEDGWDAVGITAARVPSRAREEFERWLALGYAGTMDWMGRHAALRLDPALLLTGVRSIVMLGLYAGQPRPSRRGRIATYALGADYHQVLWAKLQRLEQLLADYGGEQRSFVDSGPVMEKPLAEQAGLGWQGKQTLLIHPRLGAGMLLGCLLTSIELPPDLPATNRCGNCVRCLDACPTGAILAPYRLDARRCIAYWTIEHRGVIPPPWRELIGDRLFGCDDCLDVCPWNRWAARTRQADFDPRSLPDLAEMLGWDDATFRKVTRGTPLFRLKWAGWLRNICVVLGNIGQASDIPALHPLTEGTDPTLQEHARCAIARISQRSK